jgi:serine/threonine protein kinase
VAELSPGQILAGYRIEGVAGRGGMGVVYRATQLALDRVVALKVISPALAEDDAFRERFKRESRVAAAIRHPNVIAIHDAREESGVLFITMDFIEGVDLAELIRAEGRLQPMRAAPIVARVADALDAAHARGLVHRDVKPANVLIAQESGGEHVYLTDFGLTKAAGSTSGLTQTGMFVGTVDYVAPEQIAGEQLDARADVYALGCVLFHALTGHVPYPRGDAMAAMFAHTHLPPPSLLESAPDAPPALDAVVRRAMAKDRDERYQSAGELSRAALAATAGDSRPTAVRAPATTGESRVTVPLPVARRSRWPMALGAAVALGALGVVLALLVSGGDDKKTPTRPPVQRASQRHVTTTSAPALSGESACQEFTDASGADREQAVADVIAMVVNGYQLDEAGGLTEATDAVAQYCESNSQVTVLTAVNAELVAKANPWVPAADSYQSLDPETYTGDP